VKNIDLRVYVITADLPHLGRTHEDIASAAVAGGGTVIQFRDKFMSDPVFAAMADRVHRTAAAGGVPCIINDRVGIAIAAGADGVHVGRSDANPGEIRSRLMPGMILGLSARDYDEALEMSLCAADYLGVGPVFPTGSKPDAAPPIGPRELARICRDVRLPVVAIGGINANNLQQVIEAGVAGAAVVAAVAEAPDMQAAVAELRSIWERCGCAQR
jgi:thiamine-phosphate pyrophosphorylase